MRLFVGVRPPAAVRDVVGTVPRWEDPSFRWTTPSQWHVTLRFLGAVREDEVPALASALARVAAQEPPREARLGPETTRLGRGTLVVPVTGLDELAVAVAAATAGVGRPPSGRPFTGHLTLARGRGRRPVPARTAGFPLSATWRVDGFALLSSELHPDGARYDDVETFPLAGPAGG